jgi:hypothetical protein
MKNYKVTFTLFGVVKRANINAISIEEAQEKLKKAVLDSMVITDINSTPPNIEPKDSDPGQELRKDLNDLVTDIFTRFRGF